MCHLSHISPFLLHRLISPALISPSNTRCDHSSHTNVGWQTFLQANCCYYFVIKTACRGNIFCTPMAQREKEAKRSIKTSTTVYVGVVVIMVHYYNDSLRWLHSKLLILYKTLKLKEQRRGAMLR